MSELKTASLGRPQAQEALLPITWITVGHGIVDVYMNVIPPLLPLFAISLGLGRTEVGIVLAILSITSSGLQPIFGFLVDRWGKNWLFPASMAVTGIFAAAVGLATNVYILALLAALAGLGSALYHPLGTVAVAQLGGEKKGLAVSVYSTGGNLGYALAPIMVVPLVEGFGFPALGYLAIPAVLMALFMGRSSSLTFTPPPRGDFDLVGELHSQWRPLALLNLVSFLRCWAHISVVALAPWYLMELGFSEGAAGQMLTPFLLAGTLGGMVAGFISDHFHCRRLVIGCSLVASIVCLLFFLQTSTTLGLWLTFILLGFFLHAMVPVSVVLAQEYIPHNAGMASGLMMGLAFGLGGVGVTLNTYLSDLYGVVPGLLSIIPLLVIGSLVALFLQERG